MKCPSCESAATAVTDSRPTMGDASIRRRRLCQTCATRFTTFELTLPEWFTEQGGAPSHTPAPAFDRMVELMGVLGRLPREDARLLLVLGKKLAGDDFSARVHLERTA